MEEFEKWKKIFTNTIEKQFSKERAKVEQHCLRSEVKVERLISGFRKQEAKMDRTKYDELFTRLDKMTEKWEHWKSEKNEKELEIESKLDRMDELENQVDKLEKMIIGLSDGVTNDFTRLEKHILETVEWQRKKDLENLETAIRMEMHQSNSLFKTELEKLQQKGSRLHSNTKIGEEVTSILASLSDQKQLLREQQSSIHILRNKDLEELNIQVQSLSEKVEVLFKLTESKEKSDESTSSNHSKGSQNDSDHDFDESDDSEELPAIYHAHRVFSPQPVQRIRFDVGIQASLPNSPESPPPSKDTQTSFPIIVPPLSTGIREFDYEPPSTQPSINSKDLMLYDLKFKDMRSEVNRLKQLMEIHGLMNGKFDDQKTKFVDSTPSTFMSFMKNSQDNPSTSFASSSARPLDSSRNPLKTSDMIPSRDESSRISSSQSESSHISSRSAVSSSNQIHSARIPIRNIPLIPTTNLPGSQSARPFENNKVTPRYFSNKSSSRSASVHKSSATVKRLRKRKKPKTKKKFVASPPLGISKNPRQKKKKK